MNERIGKFDLDSILESVPRFEQDMDGYMEYTESGDWSRDE